MAHPITYAQLDSYCYGPDFYKKRRISIVGIGTYGQGFAFHEFLGIDARREYDRLTALGYSVGIVEEEVSDGQ